MKRIFLFVSLIACTITSISQNNAADMEQVRKLVMAHSAIANLYVDKVNEPKLVEAGIKAMLKELDPHSTYLTAKEVEKMNEPLQGNFEGIGVQFNMADDTLFVIQTVSKGPSEKVGILPGDRIVTVNDTAIAGVKMERDEIMKRLRGPKGSVVQLGIVRRGIDEQLVFRVTRDKIPVHTLDAAYMIAPKVGYVKISSFGATTHEEFSTALAKLDKEKMQHLILDLQGNGGGYLKAAVDIASDFLQEGQQIVYTEGAKAPRTEFKAEGKGQFREGRLVVLIDEYSASASEIVTGAVQDWDRGIVVGRRSFGKGLVQRPVPMPDGSMIRLTIARYHTPAGRCIQKPYGEDIDYRKDLVERFNKGELMHADSVHFPDSLKYQTRVMGRTVYGGGGIMPDYFVPLDTMSYTRYHRELTAKGVIANTNLAVIDRYRKEYEAHYPDFKAYEKKFEVDDAILEILLSEAERAGVKYDEELYKASLPLIKVQLKALIARDLWEMSHFYEVYNHTDETVMKGLEIIQGKEFGLKK
ncbi:MAG: S41 family peptidase [Bacteroidaceae bacterium]|nr:S41 family peptidase [Bacteroidaceae bacterium]